jgi:CHAT domain-containing protein
LAADQAVRTHSPQWAARAFQALELNRAASLRESLALAGVWREKLPPEYWEALGRLEAEQARSLATGRASDAIASLGLRITEMEAGAGLSFAVKKDENFRIQSSLNHFQAGLGESELFLTFLLGGDSCYVWAVSRESMHLYRLPPQIKIAAEAKTFREAVLAGGQQEAERQGRRLYEDLFGPLNSRERAKKDWLLSLEDVLFEVPFAALLESRGGKSVYLVERHSIQVVPGALLLGRSTDPRGRGGWFLGVGDPIYNRADSRWSSPRSWTRPPTGLRGTASAPGQLVRLVASGDEVHASAESWRRRSGTATVLGGFQAARETFLDRLASLDGLAQGPRVIHLSTHVLFPHAQLPESGHEQALIAFSIPRNTPGAGPQYLSTTRIATLHVPGALVVMTGCATGTGDAQAGAGLLGLTRAWLMAGAAGVLATAWPVEDSPGEIFSRFYRYYPETSAAEALRRSQVEMLRRTSPAHWASYQLTGRLH